MMGPDYTHWHGTYEVAKHFYSKYIPELQELAEKQQGLQRPGQEGGRREARQAAGRDPQQRQPPVVPQQDEPRGESPARQGAQGVPEALFQVAEPSAAIPARPASPNHEPRSPTCAGSPPRSWSSSGQHSLREHLARPSRRGASEARAAHRRQARALPHDPECLRYPTRLVFEFGEMAMHQFAQPDLDWRNTGAGRPGALPPPAAARPPRPPAVLAVAYMIPVINYGDIITDEHCLLYGADAAGMMEDEYYERSARWRTFRRGTACGGQPFYRFG